MQLPDSRKRQAGPEGEEPLTGTHVPIPYMGTHCERNRVPHERYILPSQPTAPFRDVAFHIAAVSPLVPIADRYRLTYACATPDPVSRRTSFLHPSVFKTGTSLRSTIRDPSRAVFKRFFFFPLRTVEFIVWLEL